MAGFRRAGHKLPPTHLLMITKVLAKFTNLKIFKIDDITDQLTEYLMSIISHNVHLQYFGITNSNLCTTSVIKIAKVLQNTSNLQELTITVSSTRATNFIATVVSDNSKIQNLDLDDVNLQTICIFKTLSIANLQVKNKISSTEAAESIVPTISCDLLLQELDISEKSFLIATFTKALQSIFIFKKLYINNKITEETADDIAAAFSFSSQLKVFDISGSYVKTLSMIKIAEALQQISTLQQFYINDNITDKAADNIAAAIRSNTQLKEFCFSKNNLQSIGAIKIAKALQCISSLTKLTINDNHITDEAADDIAAAIYNNIELQELNVSKNNLRSTGVIKIAKALKDVSSLTKLNVSDNHITDEAAGDIAAAIYNNIKLQELNVSKNNLQSAGIIKIAEALKNISTLTKLYINNNHITNKAAYDIATVFPCNTQLQELDISNNWFQATGIMVMASALQNIVTLTKLYIGNYSLSNEVANSIAIVLHHNTELQEIDIGSNMNDVTLSITGVLCKNANLILLRMKVSNNSEEAVESIAAAVASNIELQVLDISGLITVNTKFIKALQCISSLTSLCISNSKITDEVVGNLGVAVSCNTQLQELDINSNNLKTTGTIKFLKALKGTVTLKKLFISNNNITDGAANVLSFNTQLQELDISYNCFQAVGIAIIMKALQGMLTRLYISNNNITEDAADDIAAAIYGNTQLQEFDVGNNNLQSTGVIKIAKALQTISTLTKLYIH